MLYICKHKQFWEARKELHEDRLYFMVCFCHVPLHPKTREKPKLNHDIISPEIQAIKTTKEIHNERERKQCLQ